MTALEEEREESRAEMRAELRAAMEEAANATETAEVERDAIADELDAARRAFAALQGEREMARSERDALRSEVREERELRARAAQRVDELVAMMRTRDGVIAHLAAAVDEETRGRVLALLERTAVGSETHSAVPAAPPAPAVPLVAPPPAEAPSPPRRVRVNRHGSIDIRNESAVAEVAAAAAKYHAEAGRGAPPSPPSPPSPPMPPAAPSPPPSALALGAPAAMAPWPVPELAIDSEPAEAEGIFYYRAAFMWTRPLAPRVSAAIDAQRTSDRLASGFPNALFSVDRRVYKVRTPRISIRLQCDHLKECGLTRGVFPPPARLTPRPRW